mgnify:CR=1 FL=1
MTAAARLHREVIDPRALLGAVSGPASGALLLFLGVVREVNDGRAVTGIEYLAYEEMAARELAAIAREAVARFDAVDVVIEHRLGELALEETSVGIAVAHPHREQAYAASRGRSDECKRRGSIGKREHYADGTREWVGQGAQGEHRAGAVSP